jgi:hypothetical protein
LTPPLIDDTTPCLNTVTERPFEEDKESLSYNQDFLESNAKGAKEVDYDDPTPSAQTNQNSNHKNSNNLDATKHLMMNQEVDPAELTGPTKAPCDQIGGHLMVSKTVKGSLAS